MQNVVVHKMVTEDYAKHISLCIDEENTLQSGNWFEIDLMNVISYLDKPTRGEYLFSEYLWRTHGDQLAEVYQNMVLFSDFNLLTTETALQNVELPMICAGSRYYLILK